jgi:pimeloyl-[acyl-carrier protein] synthase
MTDEVLFNPFAPEFHDDPYPFYRRLREREPIHQMAMGAWVLTRYDDVVAALKDPRLGRAGFDALLSAVYGAGNEDISMPPSMLFRDPPDHTRLRSLVNRAFTPRVVEGLRPRIVAIVDGLLDRVQDRGRMDVIADLAYPLPVTVISEMLGVPPSDHEAIKQWSADIARGLDAIGMPVDPEVIARASRGRRELGEYFRRLIPERRRQPREDLLTLLIAAEEQGDRLTEGELLSTCVLLYVAGHETTVNLIGNGLLALLRHPAELARLRAHPELSAGAVEELLRYDAPVQRTGRTAHEDIELGGHHIAKGSLVVPVIGAANRDAAHFPDPDRLDLGRRDNRHVAFGFGIHFCLGAPLARLEGQIALGRLLARFGHLTAETDRPTWRQSSTLRGLAALPVSARV